MKRRDFLFKVAAPAAVLPFTIGGWNVRAFGHSPSFQALADSTGCDDRVLVLVQLVGGNDGLNTVIPLDQYSVYHAARTNIAIPEKDIIKLTDATGLHPNLDGLERLYKDGHLSVIQNVGYPTPNFSHFRSVDVWATGSDYDQFLTTGWMGRYLEQLYPGYPFGYPKPEVPDPIAIQVGSIISPVLDGTLSNLGMAFTNPGSYYDINEFDSPNPKKSAADDVLGFIKQTGDQISKFAVPVKEAASKTMKHSPKWPTDPKNTLAPQLKVVSQLITGGLKTKVYIVTLPGFDTHSSQNIDAGVNSPHPSLLRYLSTSVAAFMDELKLNGQAERVLGMTFSEFGRRIISNSAAGTDHGAAAPLFVFGAKVKGGILGNNPKLPDKPTVEDNIAMQVDYRSVYSSVLKEWFCADEALLRKTLFKDFQSLPLLA